MSEWNVPKTACCVTSRICKCRICEKEIPRYTLAVVMRHIKVSPRRVDLWFHAECLVPVMTHISTVLMVSNRHIQKKYDLRRDAK